jgi:hypothetical protein
VADLSRDAAEIDLAVFTCWFEADDAFPRLCGLRIHSEFIEQPHGITILHGFLRPSSLTCLEVYCPQTSLKSSQSQILEASASTLTELKLYLPEDEPSWLDFQDNLISGTRSLRSVWIEGPISYKGFVGLAANSKVEFLLINYPINPSEVP